jgi:type III pantothenate kinase
LILVADAGNSRVKWAMHDGQAFTQEAWVALDRMEDLAAAWSSLPPPAAVAVANVAGPGVREALGRLVARWDLEPVWVEGARRQCGVTSLYEDPRQLGPDRWAALIGARQRVRQTCLVVNSGTAMTVDAMSASGEFLGGLIVPGFDLMHRSLGEHTARLTADRGRFTEFPRNSADAITSGAVQSLCGAIERMARAIERAGHGRPGLLLTGGAAAAVREPLGMPAQYVERLVLEGLVCIAKEPPAP